MKSLKQIREQKELIIEREEAEERKLTSLVRAGLFDSKKLPALKRALDKSADKISGQEKRMLINLLDSLIDQVLSNQSVYQKVKQNVMKEEYEELDEGRLDPTTRDINDLPNIIMLRRRAIRSFPGGGKVVMYWADKINRYIPIPVDPVNTITRGPHLDSGLMEALTPEQKKAQEIRHATLRSKVYSQRRAKIGDMDDDDPEAAVQGYKASSLLKRIGKKSGEVEKIRVAATGKNVQKKAADKRMIRLRKQAGGEHGYISQAAGFAKSGQKAAALGTLAGGAVGSLVRRFVKEGLETTRIKMKKMTVSPLTGVRKNAVVRESFSGNLENIREERLDENPLVAAGIRAIGAVAKPVLKYAGRAISKWKAGRTAAAADKAAKVAKKEKQLSKLDNTRLRNKEAAKERIKLAREKNALRTKKPSKIGKIARRLGAAGAVAAAVSGSDSSGGSNASASPGYETKRREVARTAGESSFKTNARTGDFATRQAKDNQLQRRAFQTENIIENLKTIQEGEEKNISLRDGNSIDIGYGLATRIINIYESMNKNNKQTMANMLEESVDNFKKIGQFAIDNGK